MYQKMPLKRSVAHQSASFMFCLGSARLTPFPFGSKLIGCSNTQMSLGAAANSS